MFISPLIILCILTFIIIEQGICYNICIYDAFIIIEQGICYNICIHDFLQYMVDLIFAHFILFQTVFVHPHFVHHYFGPTLDLSILLSSKTYNRSFCFCPILVQPKLTLVIGQKQFGKN